MLELRIKYQSQLFSMNQSHIFYSLIRQSDFFTQCIVYSLLLTSLLIVIFFIYTVMKLNKKNAHLKSLSKEIFINTGEVEIKKSKQPLIILFNDIIEKNISLSKEEKFNIMYHVTLAYLEKEKSIAIFFSVAAAAAPLIGLLGTVWGIIDAFMGMAVGGSGDLSSVAPGIAEALITTFAGLLVAIPALIFYHIINTKIKSIMSTIESIVIHILSNGSHHA